MQYNLNCAESTIKTQVLRSKVRMVVSVAGKNCVIPLTRAILKHFVTIQAVRTRYISTSYFTLLEHRLIWPEVLFRVILGPVRLFSYTSGNISKAYIEA